MAEKLEFKNDIDVISVLRTRLLGYTTAPDGTTLLHAGNLTVKEVGEAILQDSGLREEIAGIIGVHADDVEKIQEAIETLQGIDTDYGKRVTDLETNKADVTYVDTKVAEAKPGDYEAVKTRVTELEFQNAEQGRQIKANDYEIANLKATAEGQLYRTVNDTTTDGTLDIPSSAPVAPYAEINSVRGKTWAWNQMVLPYTDFVGIGRTSVQSKTESEVTFTAASFYGGLRSESRYSFTAGHRYLISFESNRSENIVFSNDNASVATNNATATKTVTNVGNGFYRIEAICDCNATIADIPIFVWDTLSSGHTSVSVRKLIIVDLTQLGTEDLTFVRKYAEAHPQYDAGTLKTAKLREVKSVGKNLAVVNQTTVSIKWNGFVLFKKADFFRDIDVTKAHVFSFRPNGLVGAFAIFGSGVADTVLTGTESKVTVVLPPNSIGTGENLAFMRTGVTVGQTVTLTEIQLEEGSEATAYEPYTETSLTLPPLELRSAGSVHDTYEPSTGKVVRNVGEVDLGSLIWFSWNETRALAYNPVDMKTGVYGGDKPNITVDGYPVVAYDTIYSGASYDCVSQAQAGFIAVYLSSAKSTTDVHDAVDGKKLYYELAEPTEETVDPISPFIGVEAGGTVSVISDDAQAEMDIRYMTQTGGNA